MKHLIFMLSAIVCMMGCQGTSRTVVTPAESSVVQQKETETKPPVDEKIIDIKIIPPKRQVEPAPLEPLKKSKDGSTWLDEQPQIMFASYTPVSMEMSEDNSEAVLDYPPEPTQPVDIEVDGKKIKAPPGSEVHVTITDKKSGAASKSSDKGEAKSKGIGVTTDASDIVGKMNLGAPTTQLGKSGGGSASGGDAEYDFKLVTEAKNYFLSILGGLMIVVGAVVWIWFQQWKLGVGLAVAGFLLIGVDVVSTKYPWVFLLAFLALGIAAFFIIRDALSKRKKEITLGVLTDAVDNSGTAGDLVKKEVSKRVNGAGPIVKAEITKMKAKLAKIKSKHA